MTNVPTAGSAASPAAADTLTYRPDVFRADDAGDVARVRALMRGVPGAAVFDRVQSQVEELIKTRHPARTLSADELARMTSTFLDGQPADRVGVWVHYPWSRRLVHLLDEPEFVELRTSRNRYKISADEQSMLGRRRIGVVGLSVGQAIALTLTIERGCGEIRLADFDVVELSNLNRIRTGVHNLGLPKVVAAAREIAEIDPFLRVECFPEGITAENLDRFLLDGGKLDVLVEEADGLDVKFLARERARALGIPVVMETSDRGMPDIERFDLEPNRPLFHGLAGDVDHRTLRGLTFEEKVPHVLAITGIETLSVRMKASMVEVGQSIATWPQIASAVALGGALGADACRRIALGQACASGRRYVDLDELVGGSDPVVCAADAAEKVITDDAGLANGAARRLSDGVRPSDDDERAVSDSSQIAELVGAGIQAPSAANHQPWEWVIAGGSLFLFHDARRSASLDFLPDASYVALGAAAENVVLAAHERGLEVDLCPLPVPGDQRLAAAFRFFASPRAGRSEPHNWDELAAAIPLRHTNRCRWERQPLEPATVVCLRATAESVAGARLRLLTDDDELASIGQILGAADRVRLFHRPSHRDLMDELRWTPEEAETTRDGIDLATLELSPLDAAGLRICRDWAVVEQVRQWRGGRVLEQSAIRAVRGASAVALLTMPCSDLAAYFTGGRAMQRFWLAATRSRLAVQPLSALPYLFARFVRNGPGDFPAELAEELKALRERYRALFPINDQTAEIFLFRLGVAVQPSARSLRRPIADVFRYAEDWERTDLP